MGGFWSECGCKERQRDPGLVVGPTWWERVGGSPRPSGTFVATHPSVFRTIQVREVDGVLEPVQEVVETRGRNFLLTRCYGRDVPPTTLIYSKVHSYETGTPRDPGSLPGETDNL